MNEGRERQRTRKAETPVEQPKPEAPPVEQEVIIYRRVSRFIERKLQPKVQTRALAAIDSLKVPTNIRGSVKIEGRPANDPMFRIDKDAYRIFCKRLEGKVHVVDMENRQGAYDKGRTRKR